MPILVPLAPPPFPRRRVAQMLHALTTRRLREHLERPSQRIPYGGGGRLFVSAAPFSSSESR